MNSRRFAANFEQIRFKRLCFEKKYVLISDCMIDIAFAICYIEDIFENIHWVDCSHMFSVQSTVVTVARRIPGAPESILRPDCEIDWETQQTNPSSMCPIIQNFISPGVKRDSNLDIYSSK